MATEQRCAPVFRGEGSLGLCREGVAVATATPPHLRRRRLGANRSHFRASNVRDYTRRVHASAGFAPDCPKRATACEVSPLARVSYPGV